MVKTEKQRAWRARNKDKVAEYNRRQRKIRAAYKLRNKGRWSAADSARVRRWKRANPERVRAHYRQDYSRHPERFAEAAVRRRAKQRSQTPLLTNEERADIAAIYAKARALTELTGTQHHVDHKTSLAKGGLHCPGNLQILTATENLKKGAR